MMDSDVVVMDDPYKYFKHPPFKGITVLNQAESPEDSNGGVLYVQNAAPDGPAAFMFTGSTTLSPHQLALRCPAAIRLPLSPLSSLPAPCALYCLEPKGSLDQRHSLVQHNVDAILCMHI